MEFSSNGYKVSKIDLDSEWAAMLLGHNVTNRPTKRGAIERYVEDMVAGHWQFTAEPIKIDTETNLLDGQNRCHAVILAAERLEQPDFSIPVLLVEGLSPQAQDVMDSGKPRSLGDQLSRRGVGQYARMSATVRAIVMYQTDDNRGTKAAVSNAVTLQFYDRNAELLHRLNASIADYKNTSGVNSSVLVAARFLIHQACTDENAIEEFFIRTVLGTELPDQSPILALRTRALAAKMNREVMPNQVALNMTLRAWNAFRKGESLGKMPVRTRGRTMQVKEIAL